MDIVIIDWRKYMYNKLPFKIILIHKEENIPYDIIPHTEIGYNHALSFVKYFETHYQNDIELQQMDVRTNPNTISLALVARGNIVVLDTTSYRKDLIQKYGKSILFLFPEEMSKLQMETMESLLPLFENASDYTIWYNFNKIDGETKCECLMGKNIKLITNYLESYQNQKKK